MFNSGRNCKKLLLFDVDGTLVDSGNDIDHNMVSILKQLKDDGYDLGIAGGGDFNKIIKQMKNEIYFDHYFSECGCVYFKNLNKNSFNLQLIYKKNIREHEMYLNINKIIKKSLEFLSKVEYTLTGNFVDLRTGIVYISLIGMTATQEERKYFKDFDIKNNIRRKLLNILNDYAIELKVSNSINIVEGGSVGIAIYPKEWDKVQVLSSLNNYKEIFYFGDKYECGGNDYSLITHEKVKGIKVNCKEETYRILQDLKIT